MLEKVTPSIEQTLQETNNINSTLKEATQKNPEEMDTTALLEAIKHLESTNNQLTTRLAKVEDDFDSYKKRTENAESSVSKHESDIERIFKRIHHDGKLFSYATDVKDISLEELTKTFKNHVERFKQAELWQADKVSPVEDHSARIQRLENSNKNSFEHLLQCMKKLDIKFRMEAGDDIAGVLASVGVDVPAPRGDEKQVKMDEPETEPTPPSPSPSPSPAGSGLSQSKWASPSTSPSSPSPSSPSPPSPSPSPSPVGSGLSQSKWASSSTAPSASPAPSSVSSGSGLSQSKWAASPTPPASAPVPVPPPTGTGLAQSKWAAPSTTPAPAPAPAPLRFLHPWPSRECAFLWPISISQSSRKHRPRCSLTPQQCCYE